jgi:hypothetical protein
MTPPMAPRITAGILAFSLLALASACSRERLVQPPSAFPPPLVLSKRLPVALEMDAAFRDYRHQASAGGTQWTLAIGPSSVDWVGSLLRSSFTEVAERRDAQGVRLVFLPAIEDVQFSLPEQSGSEFYEAWIQYRIRVEQPDGRQVADWAIPAYGKARDAVTLGADTGLGLALNKAMRDATAALVQHINDPQRVAELLRPPPTEGSP